MNFIKNIKDSIFSPEFYRSIPSIKFSSALLYFIALTSILALIQTIIFTAIAGTFLPPLIDSAVKGIENKFPANLEVSIKNGQVSTNANEPYIIPMDANVTVSNRAIKNLLVIDTKTPFSQDQLDQYDTLFWITNDSIVFSGSSTNGNSNIISLNNVQDLTINKGTIDKLYNSITPYFKYISPVIFIALLFFFVFWYLFKLIYLLLLALFILVVAKLLNWEIGYKQSIKVGLFAMTTGLFIESIQVVKFPFMFTIVTLIMVAINIMALKKESSQVIEEQPAIEEAPKVA